MKLCIKLLHGARQLLLWCKQPFFFRAVSNKAFALVHAVLQTKPWGTPSCPVQTRCCSFCSHSLLVDLEHNCFHNRPDRLHSMCCAPSHTVCNMAVVRKSVSSMNTLLGSVTSATSQTDVGGGQHMLQIMVPQSLHLLTSSGNAYAAYS